MVGLPFRARKKPCSNIMRIRARHYATGDWTDLEIENGRITSIGPAHSLAPDLQAGWVAPALFDLQINGCDGH